MLDFVEMLGASFNAVFRAVLDAARAAGIPIVHTREGHRTDLSDLPDNKKWRSKAAGAVLCAVLAIHRIL
jgi:biuret amidohydrolase